MVHPASLWSKFGPINLEVEVPQGVRFAASVPCGKPEIRPASVMQTASKHSVKHAIDQQPRAVYQATVNDKTGELFLAVDAGDWDKLGGSVPVALKALRQKRP